MTNKVLSLILGVVMGVSIIIALPQKMVAYDDGDTMEISLVPIQEEEVPESEVAIEIQQEDGQIETSSGELSVEIENVQIEDSSSLIMPISEIVSVEEKISQSPESGEVDQHDQIEQRHENSQGNQEDHGDRHIKTYTVSFNSDGGSAVALQRVKKGERATEPVAPTKEGYVFVGWYKSGVMFNFDTVITADTKLEARWVKAYAVTFNANGGSSVADQNVKRGEKAIEPVAPSRVGYAFIGWFRESHGCDVLFNFNTPIIEAIVLKARWEKVHTVYFDTDGESVVVSQSVKNGCKAVEPEEPVKMGYVFEGWYKGEKKFNFDTPIVEDVELRAKWTAVWHTVSFNTDGGTAILSQTVQTGGMAIEPVVPTKKGHIFTGWYIGEKLFNFDTKIIETIELKAGWEVEVYAISYSGLEGAIFEESTNPESYTILTPNFSLQRPVKEGYVFEGWTGTDTGKTVAIMQGSVGDRYYEAVWSPVIFEVEFVDYDGRRIALLEVEYGKGVIAPLVSAREGYIFDGWATNDYMHSVKSDLVVKARYRVDRTKLNLVDGNMPIDVDKDAVFAFEGEYQDVAAIKVDGQIMYRTPISDDSENLSGYMDYPSILGKAERGSVVVTLYKEFLKTLSGGVHSVEVEFKDGSVQNAGAKSFVVKEDEKVSDGETEEKYTKDIVTTTQQNEDNKTTTQVSVPKTDDTVSLWLLYIFVTGSLWGIIVCVKKIRTLLAL